ncbi:MAG: hypothetical protein KAG96_06995 [Ichthyobacteriaceae bacterium]|nr:hypothetical protein [Ichthyobacteriaceae bacterium]
MKAISKFYFLLLIIFTVSCSTDSKKEVSILGAVPENSLILFKFKNITDAYDNIKDNLIYKSITEFSKNNGDEGYLYGLKAFLDSNKVDVEDITLLISVHKIGVKSYDYLMYLDETKVDIADYKKLERYVVKKNIYDNAEILEYKIKNIKTSLFSTSFNGVLVVGRSKILLESAIRQLNSKRSLIDNEVFSNLYNALNEKLEFNVLINTKYLSEISEYSDKSNSNYISWLKDFAEWTALDVSISKDEIFASGVLSANDSLGSYLTVFKNHASQKIVIDDYFPSFTSMATVFAFENYPKYQKSLNEYYRKNGKLNKILHSQAQYNIKKEDVFDSWIDNQIAIVSTSLKSKSVSYNDVVIIKSIDRTAAKEPLSLISDGFSVDYRGIEIKKIKESKILSDFIGGIVDDLKSPYYVLIGDVVIFSNNQEILKSTVGDFLGNRGVTKYEYFQKLKDNISDGSNIVLYFKNPDFFKEISSVFPHLKSFLDKYSASLSKYKAGAIEISYDNKVAFLNMQLNELEVKEKEVKHSWNLNFERKLYTNVNSVVNHRDKSIEIAVQDVDNQLHLISSNGEVLWTKSLTGEIIGNIAQVDLYRNRKLQLIFNTENKIYIIDRNGNDVDGYPKTLPYKSTAPMAVFDYSNNRKYRFLVPMGKHVRMFDKAGKHVKGFEFKNAKSSIDKQPQHFNVKEKDYVVFSSEDGTVYILDRRGRVKLDIKEKYKLGKNAFYFNESNGKPNIYTTTVGGKMLKIYLSGVVKEELVKGFGSNTIFRKFDNIEFSVTNNFVKISSDKINEVKEFDVEELSCLEVFILKKEPYILVSDALNKNIYALDSDLDIQKGFPIFGQYTGKVLDYNRDGVFTFPVLVNEEKGNIKMFSIN